MNQKILIGIEKGNTESYNQNSEHFNGPLFLTILKKCLS